MSSPVRLFTGNLNESGFFSYQFWCVCIDVFVIQGSLRNVIEVEVGIFLQGSDEFGLRGEMCLFEQAGYPAVEAAGLAVGLRVLGRDQAMFDLVSQASLVEGVVACGLSFAGSAESVGELFSVVQTEI